MAAPGFKKHGVDPSPGPGAVLRAFTLCADLCRPSVIRQIAVEAKQIQPLGVILRRLHVILDDKDFLSLAHFCRLPCCRPLVVFSPDRTHPSPLVILRLFVASVLLAFDLVYKMLLLVS